jgi:hypothetical protein
MKTPQQSSAQNSDLQIVGDQRFIAFISQNSATAE